MANKMRLRNDENNDFARRALKSARPVKIGKDGGLTRAYEDLAVQLINQAYANAASTKTSVGTSLAAAFDLFVAADYYSKITNDGWLYCPHKSKPLLLYPYTNACPRCLLSGTFHFHKANKLGSGCIGATTRNLLCVFLSKLFTRHDRRLTVQVGTEPVDVVIYDADTRTVLLAEVKAAPLTTMGLAVPVSPQTEIKARDEPGPVADHRVWPNPSLLEHQVHVFMPVAQRDSWTYELVPLGKIGTRALSDWAIREVSKAFADDAERFQRYFQFWTRAFEVYKKAPEGSQECDNTSSELPSPAMRSAPDPVYWFTNACGQPFPRPPHWPRRSGTGYESVSDGKSSVGMDRTDDIKKGTYQVLKIGAEGKPKSSLNVKTALISNIHAVRHRDAYLRDLQSVVWTVDAEGHARHAKDLPPEQDIYNLFDGIISFTEVFARDEWIERIFGF